MTQLANKVINSIGDVGLGYASFYTLNEISQHVIAPPGVLLELEQLAFSASTRTLSKELASVVTHRALDLNTPQALRELRRLAGGDRELLRALPSVTRLRPVPAEVYGRVSATFTPTAGASTKSLVGLEYAVRKEAVGRRLLLTVRDLSKVQIPKGQYHGTVVYPDPEPIGHVDIDFKPQSSQALAANRMGRFTRFGRALSLKGNHLVRIRGLLASAAYVFACADLTLRSLRSDHRGLTEMLLEGGLGLNSRNSGPLGFMTMVVGSLALLHGAAWWQRIPVAASLVLVLGNFPTEQQNTVL